MKILVLNSGSSSQKSCLYEIGDSVPTDPPACLWEGKIEWNGDIAEIQIKNAAGKVKKDHTKIASRAQAIEHLLNALWSGETQAVSAPSEIKVVGHRVVHGGPKYKNPTVITPEVKAAIAGVSAFAPLHNRAELEGIAIVEKLLGSVPQIAVFDTGFHQTIPPAAAVYPGPYEWIAEGIHRYGFHGINHQYCASRAARLLDKDPSSLKLVSCHLGNGCSLAAIRNGQSIDTTMGFTPLEGLMMGTRSGSVDPGILTYLIRQKGISAQRLDEILNKESGLLGISGLSTFISIACIWKWAQWSQCSVASMLSYSPPESAKILRKYALRSVRIWVTSAYAWMQKGISCLRSGTLQIKTSPGWIRLSGCW
jgi:acetate kinase